MLMAMKKERDAGVDDDGSVAVVSTAFTLLKPIFDLKGTPFISRALKNGTLLKGLCHGSPVHFV